MGVVVSGRVLGVAVNGRFTRANTDPIVGGRLWPEAAAAWGEMRRAAVSAGVAPGEFVPTGPASSARTFAQQVELRRQWCALGHCEKAAVPGTSNHGWGIAVDTPSPRVQAWIMRHGGRFGWSWDEGRRAGEPWHFRYVGGYRPRREGLAHLTRSERRRCRELDRLRREQSDPARRRVLMRELTEQRKRIWRAAQRSGWKTANRRKRYLSLLARTR